MSKISDLIQDEIEASEAAEFSSDPDAPLPEGTRVTRGNGRSRVLQVRLNDDELELLEKHASEQMIPVSTMARAMLMRSLRRA